MTARLVLAYSFVAVGCVGSAPPEQGTPDAGDPQVEPTTPMLASVASGSFHAVAASTFAGEGRTLMTRTLDGKTNVSINLSGGVASTAYVAHVHAAPCQFGAGGHYMMDPALAATSTEPNELWIHAMSNDKGVIVGSATFTHLARGEALSVVVHDAVGKWACADLASDESAAKIDYTGTLAPFALAEAADQTITGTLTAVKNSTQTTFTLTLAGLDPAAIAYVAHVHTAPCTVFNAAGHYMIDTSILAPSVAGSNEIWFTVPAATATATIPVTVPFDARTDAQAIVLHRTNAAATLLKVACGNLTRTTELAALETHGPAIQLPAAAGMTLNGTASMTRKLTAVTEVVVAINGLAPGTTYAAHVHNQPCSADSGGGHYEIDKTAPAGADNEITFSLLANAQGAASASTFTPHIAEADAESVIVHGADGARLACFDLE